MPVSTGKNLVVRDAVIDAINTAAFSDTQAVAAWVPEDTEDLQIKVIATDEQGEPLEQDGSTEEVYVISVVVRQKVDPLDASESDDLCNLVTALLLLIPFNEPFASLDGPVVLIDRRPFPLCSPTVLADTGYFHGVAQLHFRDWTTGEGSSGSSGSGSNTNNQKIIPVGAGRYESTNATQTYGITVEAGLLVVTVATLTNIASGSLSLTYAGSPMTLDKSDYHDSSTKRITVYVFSLAVSAGSGNLVFTPAGGVAHNVIEFGAVSGPGLTVLQCSQSKNGESASPVNLSTGATTAQTTVNATTVISAFAIHCDLAPISWKWGALLTSTAQDERSYVGSAMTALTTGSRALTQKQAVIGILAGVSGVANAIYAGAVVAYGGSAASQQILSNNQKTVTVGQNVEVNQPNQAIIVGSGAVTNP